MIVTFWTVIIFVLFNWTPNGLCLNFNVDKEVFICRAVLRHDPWIGTNVLKKTADLKCWRIPLVGQTGKTECVLTTLNNTRYYVHLTSRNCDIVRIKYSGSEFRCSLPDEEARLLLNGTSKKIGKFTKISSKYIVYFINSTRVKYAISGSRRFKWGTKLERRHWNVFTCSKLEDSIRRKKREVPLRSEDTVFGKTFVRERRNILGNYNNSTAFSAYFSHTSSIISQQVRPLLTPSVQSSTVTSRNVTVPSRSATDVWDLCRQSYVNRTAIFVPPTLVGAQHAATSLAATSQVIPTTYFATTSMLRNNTHTVATHHLGSAATLPLNATSTWTVAHFEKRTVNATYSNGSVSVMYTTQGSTFRTTLRCDTVTQTLITTKESLTTPNSTPTLTTTAGDDTKHKQLYVGLIAGGGVVLTIIICIALFLLVRRYRRIQALRRTAKQISYFNRFDCSSPWDEPDRFGGSKLSVFTLKNSKFDIDWESNHDGKQ